MEMALGNIEVLTAKLPTQQTIDQRQVMKLKIPAGQATKILQDRLREINGSNFNPKAWKDKTENDLREIFPLGSMQWLQISQIHFETFVTSEKSKVLAEAKETARQLISSYIDFIQQYSKIDDQKQITKERDYEQKYIELLTDWNELVPGYNELIKKYDNQLTTTEGLLESIEVKDQELERIKTETIQLDNVSFKKLWSALFNLPTGQLISIFSFLIVCIIGAFSLGKLYERTSANNELFDLRNSERDLESRIEQITFSYDSLKHSTKAQVDTVKTTKINDTIR